MFENVRIPRNYMLMGINELSKEGECTMKGDPRVLLTAMMYIRVFLTQFSGFYQAASTQICTRYCAVRRQFTQQGTKEERKVIDY
jgi:hypothetical protein